MYDEELKVLIEKQIDEFVEKYCIKHHVTEQEARQHALVKITANYYREGKLS